jgi:hypothetical protein
MSNISLRRFTYRARRLWITEALLVAAILAFGGFALLSDARVTPSGLLSGVADFVAR